MMKMCNFARYFNFSVWSILNDSNVTRLMKKILLILQLFVGCCTAVVAQSQLEFFVVNFEERPFDMAAKDERYMIKDGNGDLFSIIKLRAATHGDDLRAYSFDFGLPESRVKNIDGEVWVYVQRNAMRVKIRREGYAAVTYELPVTVQPGRVYEMKLQATPRIIKKRILLFEIEPVSSGAQVTYKAEGESDYRLFGNGVIDESGMATMRLEHGTYYYRIISRNYRPSEGIIHLDDSPLKFVEKVVLHPSYATLALKTIEEADIYIDGEKVGTGEWSGILSPGNYNVECRMKNHTDSFNAITVSEGDSLTIYLEPPLPITGTLALNSSPMGATVFIDGKECGSTPEDFAGLLVGNHKVDVVKNGYGTVSLDVLIKKDEIIEQNVVLEKLISKTKASEKQSAAVVAKPTKESVAKKDKVREKQKNTAVVAKADKERAAKEPKVQEKPKSAATAEMNGKHECVDLGLPSGVKWATCNVGAMKPEQSGDYYSWGEIEAKMDYSASTYNNVVAADTRRADVLSPDEDVAHVKWGGNWRMPTLKEVEELVNNCKWFYTMQGGVRGYKLTGPNGNSIFLPAAGYRDGTSLVDNGSYGHYWSSTQCDVFDDYSYYLYFSCHYCYWYSGARYTGRCVRPVCK